MFFLHSIEENFVGNFQEDEMNLENEFGAGRLLYASKIAGRPNILSAIAAGSFPRPTGGQSSKIAATGPILWMINDKCDIPTE